MLARVTSELKFHRSASRMHSEQPVKTPAYSTAVTPLFCSSPISPSCCWPARPPPPLPSRPTLTLRCPARRTRLLCNGPRKNARIQTDRQTTERSGARGHGAARGAAHRWPPSSAAGPGTLAASPAVGPARNRDPRPTPRAGPTDDGPKDRPAASPASQQPGPPR